MGSNRGEHFFSLFNMVMWPFLEASGLPYSVMWGVKDPTIFFEPVFAVAAYFAANWQISPEIAPIGFWCVYFMGAGVTFFAWTPMQKRPHPYIIAALFGAIFRLSFELGQFGQIVAGLCVIMFILGVLGCVITHSKKDI